MSAPTPVTYFWAATLAFPTPAGPATWSGADTFTTASPVSRAKALREVRELAKAKSGVPDNANLMFFMIERDQVAPPVPDAVVASVLAEVRATLDDDSADRTYALESVEQQLSALEVAS